MLPGLLNEIAQIAGRQAALDLAKARGGTFIYVPKRLPAGHWLIAIVGLDHARAIAKALPGRHLLPMGPKESHVTRWRKIAALIERKDCSVRDIALALGMHVRTIEMHKQADRLPRVKRALAQRDLFEG